MKLMAGNLSANIPILKEHTNEERGGGRDPGVRRPG